MNPRLCVIQKFAFENDLDLDGLIMKIINKDEDRPALCAINHLHKEPKYFRRVCAGKCNCGQIHQLFGDKAVWDISIPLKDFSILLARTDENSLLNKLF